MLFTTVDALELIVRLKRRSDLAYFEVKYLSRQIQRYFIFWDPRSNDPANNRAQHQEVYDNQVFLYALTSETFSFAEILPNITSERLYIILRALLEKLPSERLAEFEDLSEEACIKRYWRLLEFLDASLDNLDEYLQKSTTQTKKAIIKVIQNQVVVEDDEVKTQALCFAEYEELLGYRLQLNEDFWHEFALVLAEISFFGVDPAKRATNIAKFKQILPDEEQLYFYRQTAYLAPFLKILPQNQAAIYQDLAQGYRQVTLENATLRMDFIGQDSDLLYAFITDYQQDFMEFVKANRAQRS